MCIVFASLETPYVIIAVSHAISKLSCLMVPSYRPDEQLDLFYMSLNFYSVFLA